MNRRQKILLAITAIIIISKVILNLGIFFYPSISSDGHNTSSANTLIYLTNKHRLSRGLTPLTQNSRLTQAAINHANDIISKNYFEHTSPDGKKFSDWIKDMNYKYFYVGENLAIDFEDDNQVFQAWLESPAHRANIEKSQYQEIGIASVKGKINGRSTMVVVQLFGSRVLGTNEQNTDNQPSHIANNYFHPEQIIEKYFTSKNVRVLNIINDYLLIILLSLIFITYKPLKSKNQPIIKRPITKRYQAKTFKE